MKRAVCVVVLLGILTGMTGCFVWVRDCESSKPAEHPTPLDSTIAEIDAAKMLSTDEARLNLLLIIAQRPMLSPEARIHLVEAAKMLSTDDARVQLLSTLAENAPVPPQPPLAAPQPQPQPALPQPPQPPANPQ